MSNAAHVEPGHSGTPWPEVTTVVASVALVIATVGLAWGVEAPRVAVFDGYRVLELLAFLTFVSLGVLLASRRPHHPVGWLLAALGMSVLVQQATQAYAVRALTTDAWLPAGPLASWLSEWLNVPPLGLLTVLLVVFPSGRPASRRWRGFAWSVAIGTSLLTIGWAAAVWQRGAPLLAGGAALPPPLDAARIALIACVPIAVASLLWRFRHGSRLERQQLKWLLLAGFALVAAVLAGLVATAIGLHGPVIDALGIVSVAGVADAMAAAVLRYRLYEIDRILSRTVSYSLLTALLVALYSAAVVSLGALLEPVSPGSDVAVAAATLLVAGTFAPARTRVQGAVDRRFNRARYDAELTVLRFRERIRDDVQLTALRDALLATVSATVQPQRVSVWLPSTADVPRRTTGSDPPTRNL